MRARTYALCLAAALALPSIATVSRAEDVEKAKTYFNAGAAAYGAGQYAAAIQAFTESYALAPRPAILFSLAQAERRQYAVDHDPDRIKSAIAHLRSYIEQVPKGGRRGDAVDLLVELEALSSAKPEGDRKVDVASAKSVNSTRIMVSTTAKDATITIDGVVHNESPAIDEVKPGKRHVKVTAPGYFDDERDVTCLENNLLAVDVTLNERPAHLSIDAASGSEINVDGRPYGSAPINTIELPPGTHLLSVTLGGHKPMLKRVTLARGESVKVDAALPQTGQRVASYFVLGAAGVSLLAAGGLTGISLYEESHAKGVLHDASVGNISAPQLHDFNDALDKRNQFRAAAYVTYGVTGALVLTGGLMWLLDHPRPGAEGESAPRGEKKVRVGFAAAPLVGGGGFATVFGAF